MRNRSLHHSEFEFGDDNHLGRHTIEFDVQADGVVMTTRHGILLESHRYFFTHAEFRQFSTEKVGPATFVASHCIRGGP